MHPFVLLTAEETRKAEQAAIAGGIASAQLMERAGSALAQYVEQVVNQNVAKISQEGDDKVGKAERPPVAILCGPGNNGGDGFVLARLLRERGWPVRVGLLGQKDQLQGDAALMARLYEGDIAPLTPAILDGAGVIVDAILGIGLSRPIEGTLADIIDAVNKHPAPVIAVDMPTGVHSDNGVMMGSAVQADRTLTFITRKPGHVLYPGRGFCGVTDIAAIGIDDAILTSLHSKLAMNDLGLWALVWPLARTGIHKYARGAVAVLSGGMTRTGAARLAARGALRIGAGVVSVLSPPSAVMVNAGQLTSIMVRSVDGAEAIAAFLQDERYRSVVVGPGLGLDETLRDKVFAVLQSKALAVLDADALTGFAKTPDILFEKTRATDILTPHEGEFRALFPDIAIADYGRLHATRLAAQRCGSIVVLKGSDTIIAAPDGRAVVNVNAPADLATAGSGDVLAGFIAGLAAQSLPDGQLMPAFEAAMAGVWLHGACGQQAGPGLIAEDLPDMIPSVLRSILNAGN